MWGDLSSWFWFAFPWWLVRLGIFSRVHWPYACLLSENVYSGTLPIFWHWVVWGVCLFVCLLLHGLDINSLVDISFENTFSHWAGGLFVLLIASFTVQKLFSLMYSHLFIFAFVFPAWEDISRNLLLNSASKSTLPVFPSRSFIVSGLTIIVLLSISPSVARCLMDLGPLMLGAYIFTIVLFSWINYYVMPFFVSC